MKRIFIAGMGAFALIVTVPFTSQIPAGFGVFWHSASAIAQNIKNQPKLQLVLQAEKQIRQKDNQGKQKVTWQTLTGKVSVQPGDVLRYTLNAENKSDRLIKNLTLNQPIPKGMTYILKSATVPENGKITYSIDGGRNFVENPTVKITLPNGKVETRPAPASAYTTIRLQIPSLAAKSTLKASYQTQVR